MPPGDLVEVLAQLPEMKDDNLIVGADTLDDAGVYRIDGNIGLIQTLDFFPPMVDDPVWFGRIAAANALSDVFAMGGRAITAMNIVGFPAGLPTSILGRILQGGSEKIIEAGAVLLGGHSVRDSEIKYGLSVSGLVPLDQLITNAAAQPGDRLVLTKPLGMGAVTNAIKQKALEPDQIDQACALMATLNLQAAQAATAVAAHAMTDITGFGLLGHARGMAAASRVVLELVAADLPVFPAAKDLVARGHVSGAVARNRSYLADQVEVGGSVPDSVQTIAFDAETSGGLLIAVPEGALDRLLTELRSRKTLSAQLVGRVLPPAGDLRVRLV